MDHAVALVEAYLRVNGYFTVSEYPVVEARRYGGFRTATDLDILAFASPEQAGSCHQGRMKTNTITLQIQSWVVVPTVRRC